MSIRIARVDIFLLRLSYLVVLRRQKEPFVLPSTTQPLTFELHSYKKKVRKHAKHAPWD